MDWKWLFILPEYGIATVNDLAAPVDRPIRFHITSLERDEFLLHPRARRTDLRHAEHGNPAQRGDQQARAPTKASAPIIRAQGFNYMRFAFHGMSASGLRAMGSRGAPVRPHARPRILSQARTAEPEVPVIRYGSVPPHLYQLALNNCVAPGTPCIADQMRRDTETAARATPASDHDPRHGDAHHSTMPVGGDSQIRAMADKLPRLRCVEPG